MLATMKAAIILHNMVVELRRDIYESDLWKLSQTAVGRGMILDSDGIEKKFHWNSRLPQMSQSQWANKVVRRDERITDEVEHFNLKADLIEHVWNHCKK